MKQKDRTKEKKMWLEFSEAVTIHVSNWMKEHGGTEEEALAVIAEKLGLDERVVHRAYVDYVLS